MLNNLFGRTAFYLSLLLTAAALVSSIGCGAGGQSTSSANVPPSGSPPPSAPAPSGSRFTATGNMTVARAAHIAKLLSDGRVLIIGGKGCFACTSDPAANSAEFYDPASRSFSSANIAFTMRGTHKAVVLPGGTLLIIGGILLQDGRTLIINASNAEIYDPSTDTLTVTGAYVHSVPVVWDTVTLLQDGRVLITGCAQQCTMGATELFDPAKGAFTSTGAMRGWSNINTATLLQDGRVLFVGNEENDGTPAQAELYDPSVGTFTVISNTGTSHDDAAAVRLLDGRVLITGDQAPGGAGLPVAELYLPSATNFSFAGSMTVGRHGHTATLLKDGTVLITGGYTSWPEPTSTAEIYTPQ